MQAWGRHMRRRLEKEAESGRAREAGAAMAVTASKDIAGSYGEAQRS